MTKRLPSQTPRGTDRAHVWSKFFWADWRADERLGLCSYAARGFWMECLALMAANTDRPGHLLVAGEVPSIKTLARITRGTPAEVRRCLQELTQHGVCSYTADKVMYSRRLVRDAAKSTRNKLNGQQGGSPLLARKRDGITDDVTSRLTESVNRKPDRPDKPQKPEARSRSQKDPERGPRHAAPTRELLERFDALHRARLHQPAAFTPGKDARILADIWAERGPETLDRLLVAFFESRDPWVVEAGFTVGVFRSQLGKLLAQTAAPARSNGSVEASVRALCDRAGITRYDCDQWFHTARLFVDEHAESVVLEIADSLSRDWVSRHYRSALEAAAQADGAALVIAGAQTS